MVVIFLVAISVAKVDQLVVEVIELLFLPRLICFLVGLVYLVRFLVTYGISRYLVTFHLLCQDWYTWPLVPNVT